MEIKSESGNLVFSAEMLAKALLQAGVHPLLEKSGQNVKTLPISVYEGEGVKNRFIQQVGLGYTKIGGQFHFVLVPEDKYAEFEATH